MTLKAELSLPDPPAEVPRWCAAPTIRWLVGEGRQIPRTRDLLERLCLRLLECGVPIVRATVNIQTLHPQVYAYGHHWERGRRGTTEVGRQHSLRNSPAYLNSPFKPVFERRAVVRRRIEGPHAKLDFPILEELKARGITDYIAMPLPFSGGRVNAITWATDRPGGFADRDIAVFEDMLPILALALEVQSTNRIMQTLLDTYLGHDAGTRVRRGAIRLGSGEMIHAVLWYCDMRGFTALSDAQPQARTIAMLNQFFGALAGPVHRHGGEVLKFLGDGFLAIFRPADGAAGEAACQAIDAAREAAAAIEVLNGERAAAGEPALRYGLALHVGDVMYGNIGAPERLDFTVVGPAVNLVSRLDELSKKLDRPLIVSAEFAAVCPRPSLSLGRHGLRGVREPQEVFTLPAE